MTAQQQHRHRRHHTLAVPQLLSLLLLSNRICSVFGLLSPSWRSSATHILEHLASPPLRITPLEDLANTRIPGPPGSGAEILAYTATPPGNTNNDKTLPAIILIHEFFGLNPSIVGKAQGLADDLGCVVVAPDTYRGDVTDFIPKAIWLALTTPQGRVNDDLDAVCSHLQAGKFGGVDKLAVMGFCYGGGKAIRYSTQRRPDAATVVFYGSPVTDTKELRRLRAPVCGVYGRNDAQFSMNLLDEFREALDDAEVENDVRVYDGVGHAFWTDMEQVKRLEEPQTAAYDQCTGFLKRFFSGNDEKR